MAVNGRIRKGDVLIEGDVARQVSNFTFGWIHFYGRPDQNEGDFVREERDIVIREWRRGTVRDIPDY